MKTLVFVFLVFLVSPASMALPFEQEVAIYKITSSPSEESIHVFLKRANELKEGFFLQWKG